MQPEPSVSKPSKTRRASDRDASGLNVGSSATMRPKEVVSRVKAASLREKAAASSARSAVASVEAAAAVIGVGEAEALVLRRRETFDAPTTSAAAGISSRLRRLLTSKRAVDTSSDMAVRLQSHGAQCSAGR